MDNLTKTREFCKENKIEICEIGDLIYFKYVDLKSYTGRQVCTTLFSIIMEKHIDKYLWYLRDSLIPTLNNIQKLKVYCEDNNIKFYNNGVYIIMTKNISTEYYDETKRLKIEIKQTKIETDNNYLEFLITKRLKDYFML